ncbi:hypothetical protein MA16_Dca021096 [Dendrobium catenatum]|uniref:Uncharacterized protein n=1 Tax=Dendrobium catenatum TaxID=906689 RepID=A0A2I0VXY3_9ASPA|nr:hypothetical protein MA16_Dca021096 [Dendrobium catenatum]
MWRFPAGSLIVSDGQKDGSPTVTSGKQKLFEIVATYFLIVDILATCMFLTIPNIIALIIISSNISWMHCVDVVVESDVEVSGRKFDSQRRAQRWFADSDKREAEIV